jgi:GT2 family glycosyltransferase
MSQEMMNAPRVDAARSGLGSAGPAPEPAGRAAGAAGLVSVLVPCCGQLEYTRTCVPSLVRHSRRPYELIFVDVGSLDGTPEYLDGVAAALPARVEVIRSPAESDFAAACTEALARARGEFVVWLNNDTVVTEGWLEQLVALAGVHAAVGMAGPMSNYAPGPQRVAPVPYRIRARRDSRAAGAGPASRQAVDIEALDRFAAEWREQHKGQWCEVDRLGGFCLLIKGAVLRGIGLLDPASETGIFDADALSWKVRQAGYRCVCCRDLFIHHFGSRLASS